MITRLCHRNFGLGADSIFLSPAPLYHGAPLKFCMTALAFGSTVILQSHFDATDVLRAIEKYSVTHIQLVPTHFVRLLKLPEPVRRSYDLTSLKVAIHSAAPCPVEVKRAMIDWWGPIIHEYYSGSEGVGMTYCESADWLSHPGTVGRPVFGDMYICGEDGTELPVGDIGLVYFGGASTFKYHNDEAKTDAARNLLHPDWSTIGDIGRVDQDGFLYLTDRRANVIISGGVNIYPQEAENVLLTHPQVADAAVFGVPNAEMSEEVKAVVQPADPAIAGPELELELIAFCRERLAHYKCPRSVEFRTELPREPNGKLIKRLIKAPYWERSTAQT
jgi:acyl-CoA synthetase (AMP-forming)/AMP-acid ligase II